MVYSPKIELADYYKQYDNFIKKHFPKFKESHEVFRECLINYADSLVGQTVLEQGGGSESRANEFFIKCDKIIAVDLDKKALDNNHHASQKIHADASSVPMISDGSCDVVLSEWVIEHLKCPQKTFTETARILKKGGLYIFETPNVANPIIFMIRAIKMLSNPTSQRLTAKYLLEKNEDDIYPAYYRANTQRKLNYMLKKAGFEKVYIGYSGCPGYFRAWKPLLWLELQLEKMLSWKPLNFFQAYLICVYKKT